MNVVMLLYKDILYDARVQREAISLAEAGHVITIYCVKEYKQSLNGLHRNIRIVRHSLFTKNQKMKLEAKQGTMKKSYVTKLVRTPLIKVAKEVAVSKIFYNKTVEHIGNTPVHVVHCHDLNTLPIGYFLGKKKNAKIIYDSHELYNEMAGRNRLERNLGYVLERKLLKKVDQLIVVNPFVRKEFEKRYGHWPTTIIQNIPLVGNESIQIEEKENYWRSCYGLTQEDILVLYQGGLSKNRGIENCLKAISRLSNNYKLILLGKGNLKESLFQLRNELGLEKRVFFHEQVPANDILWYTKQADIGLVMYENTSLNNYYSTPNKIFEYLLAGIPMVASNHPGKSYIVNDGKIGVCVQETPEAIKQGIEQIEKNYYVYRENVLKYRMSVSWNSEAEKLVALYNSMTIRTTKKLQSESDDLILKNKGE